MRVLMLAQFYAPVIGGEERMVETIAGGLADRGHDVAVATLAAAGMAGREQRGGIRIHRVGCLAGRAPRVFSDPQRRHAPPWPDPVTVRDLRAVVAEERPDVVHAHNWLVHSFVPLKRSAGTALALSLHDMSLVCPTKRFTYEGAPCSGPGLGKCVRNAARHYGRGKGPPVALALRGMWPALRRAVDLFLPVSRTVAEACELDRLRLPYEVVPNFVSTPAVAAGDVPVPGLPLGAFVLCAGDLTADKGIEVLLDAHAGLDGAPPLVLIGRVESRRLRPAPENVVVLGPRPHEQVLAAWRRCTIAVVPSVLPESFGLVALEAQAAGRPVVASAIGGLGERIFDGDSGVLVPPGDAGPLRAALARLLADEGQRARIGESGRRQAGELDAAHVLPRLERAYERALRASGTHT